MAEIFFLPEKNIFLLSVKVGRGENSEDFEIFSLSFESIVGTIYLCFVLPGVLCHSAQTAGFI